MDWLRQQLGSATGKRLVHGVYWSALGTLASRLVTIATFVLVARILGKSEFGRLGVIQTTITMFVAFAGAGLGLTATKHLAEYRRTDPLRAGRMLTLGMYVATLAGGIVAATVYLLAPWLAGETLRAPVLAEPLRVGALLLWLSALQGAQQGALSGLEAFRPLAMLNLLSSVCGFPLILAGAHLGGLSGTIWGQTATTVVMLVLGQVTLRRLLRESGIPLNAHGIGGELPTLWRFSLPAALSGLLVAPVNWLCVTLLVSIPDGYDEIAIFSAANQWYAAGTFLPALISQVTLPLLAEQSRLAGGAQVARTLALALGTGVALTLPPVLLIAAGSPWIMASYGEAFAEGWPTLVVVLLTAGLTALHSPIGQVLAATGRMWVAFGMNLAWAIVFVVGTWQFREQGALGLAAARLLAYGLHLTWVGAFAAYLLWYRPAPSSPPHASLEPTPEP